MNNKSTTNKVESDEKEATKAEKKVLAVDEEVAMEIESVQSEESSKTDPIDNAIKSEENLVAEENCEAEIPDSVN